MQIVVGYSGSDGIFEKIKSLGSFSNELFWVKNKFNADEDKNVLNFIETPNLNAHKIEGYYADSFFLKLHAELSKLNENLKAPEIITKPFTFVKSVLQSISEIKDDDELNENVKKMVISCNDRIDKVIKEYEDEGTEENLKQRIVDAILKGIFNEELAFSFENEIKQKNYNDVSELSWYYNEWGNFLIGLARYQNDEVLFKESIEKFKKASKLDPKNSKIFNNWGNSLLGLARQENNEVLFKESFEKYKQASELNPKNASIFYNWGNALLELARYQNDEILFRESFEKYKQASELNPKNASFFYNLGIALSDLATNQNDETLFKESIDNFKIASELDSKQAKFFNNWGIALSKLAKYKNDEILFKESFEKYKRASELDPKDASNFYNWGIALSDLARQQNNEALFKESIEKYERALELNPKYADALSNLGTTLIELGKLINENKYFEEALKISKKQYNLEGDPYNMSCAFALLSDKENALKYLNETLDKNLITLVHINEDDDWKAFRNDEDFISLINHYKTKNTNHDRAT
ncbi:tetratricopeptide repeat protein [Chryseobacterium schmidteae]|uniref:tetratricopeptide repeat protein n=1 Tax=Chryseobacterium schmidteae TaxID=2730404 RepID=UPI00158D3D50|nr:tetratricopeptide repeat protein [Chryseobacterium schmidteae]